MIEDRQHFEDEDLDLNESDVDALGLRTHSGAGGGHEDVSPDMSHVSVVVVGGGDNNKDVQVSLKKKFNLNKRRVQFYSCPCKPSSH